MVRNFHFEEADRVALSGVPESPEAVDWLHAQGIRTVVSLHPVSEVVQARLRDLGMRWDPFLITDFVTGVPGGLRAMLERLERSVEEEPAALIH